MYSCIQCLREGLRHHNAVCSELCGDRWAARSVLHDHRVEKKDLPSQIIWGDPDGELIKFLKEP